MTVIRRAIFPVLGVVLLGACSAPPPPLDQADLQTEWEASATLPLAAADADETRWWLRFDDPALDELMRRAQLQNLDLRVADARIREARALRRGARAELLPQFDASAQAGRGRAVPTADSSASAQSRGVRDSYEVGVDASWELDLFGRLRHGARAADADLRAAVWDRDGMRLALLAEVAGAYIEYRLYQAQYALAEKNAEAQAGTERITRARFGQGIGNRLDLERAVSALATTRAQLPQQRELIETARYRLALLLASPPAALDTLLAAAAPLPAADAGAVLRAPTDVLALRPDVRAAEQRLRAAAELRDAAAALRYPRLSLSAFIGVQSADADTLFDSGTGIWSVGAGLLAPLVDFGRIRANIDAADARQEQAYLLYERTVRTALQEAQTAIVSYTQGALRERQLDTAVTAGRRAVTLAQRQYAEGTLSLLEVLDAERSLNAVELDWSAAAAAVSIRLVTLYKTFGILPAADSAG